MQPLSCHHSLSAARNPFYQVWAKNQPFVTSQSAPIALISWVGEHTPSQAVAPPSDTALVLSPSPNRWEVQQSVRFKRRLQTEG